MDKKTTINTFCESFYNIDSFKKSINLQCCDIRNKIKPHQVFLSDYLKKNKVTCVAIKIYDNLKKIHKTVFLRTIKTKSNRVFNKNAANFIFNKLELNQLKQLHKKYPKLSMSDLLFIYIHIMYDTHFVNRRYNVIVSDSAEMNFRHKLVEISPKLQQIAEIVYNFQCTMSQINKHKKQKLERFMFKLQKSEEAMSKLFDFKNNNVDERVNFLGKPFMLKSKCVKKYPVITFNKINDVLKHSLKTYVNGSYNDIHPDVELFYKYVQKHKKNIINNIVKDVDKFKKSNTQIKNTLTLCKIKSKK